MADEQPTVPTEAPAPTERKKPGPKPKPKPISVTDIVLYTTGDETERPAIVTRVHQDGKVDLTVFNSEGSVPVRNVIEGDEAGEYKRASA